MKNIEMIPRYIRLLRKYNALETKYMALKEYMKDNSFKAVLEKLGEPLEIKRLKKENKRLRLKLKALKEELKN